MATTYHELITRFRADTSGLEKGAGRASKAVGNFSKNARNGSLILQNFGEGIIDAQYGLRNITNNLDVVAARWQTMVADTGSASAAFKQLGASLVSPVGIITGLTLLINFGPQIVQFFKKWLGGVEEVDEATKKLNKSLRDTTATSRAQALELEVALDSLSHMDAIIEGEGGGGSGLVGALKLFKKYGIDPAGKSIEELREEIRKLIAEKRALAEISAKTTEFESKFADIIKKQKDFVAEYKELSSFLAQDNVNPYSPIYEPDNYNRFVLVIEEKKKRFEELKVLLRDNQKALMLLEEEYKNFISSVTETGIIPPAAVAEAAEQGKELGDALKSGIVNALQGLGQAIGQVLAGEGSFGEKFLGLLGQFMQAFGSALIAIGVGELALKTGDPIAMIAGGVALVAAGSALAAARKKNPAGSGGGSTYSASASSSQISPTQIQGSTQDVRLVGDLKLRGPDLIVALQRANDSRGALT